MFLVLLGIYYFYGILDRKQRAKKKPHNTLWICCCQGNKLFSPCKVLLVNPAETLLRVDKWSRPLAELTWSCLESYTVNP